MKPVINKTTKRERDKRHKRRGKMEKSRNFGYVLRARKNMFKQSKVLREKKVGRKRG